MNLASCSSSSTSRDSFFFHPPAHFLFRPDVNKVSEDIDVLVILGLQTSAGTPSVCDISKITGQSAVRQLLKRGNESLE